mmetsp:Transcript_46715/g.146489  ORF Transcript_46715/g.146489 Transcript_46715/m.146489 type:complete len:283 (+) Transcript_46715:683-1531(+)
MSEPEASQRLDGPTHLLTNNKDHHTSLQLMPVSCLSLALQQPQLDLLRLEHLRQHFTRTLNGDLERVFSFLLRSIGLLVSRLLLQELASQHLPVPLPFLRQRAVLKHVLRTCPDRTHLLSPRGGEEVSPLPVQVAQPAEPEPPEREEVDEADLGRLSEEPVDAEDPEEEPEEEHKVGRALDCRRQAIQEEGQEACEQDVQGDPQDDESRRKLPPLSSRGRRRHDLSVDVEGGRTDKRRADRELECSRELLLEQPVAQLRLESTRELHSSLSPLKLDGEPHES